MKKESKNIGRRFHALVVQRVIPQENGRQLYECLCDCGNIKNIDSRSIYRVHSCGCSSAKGKAHRGKRGVQDIVSFDEIQKLIDSAVVILRRHAPHLLKENRSK